MTDQRGVRAYHAALGEAALLARIEGEAVGLLHQLDACEMSGDMIDVVLANYRAVRREARAFLSRSESRPGPDAPSYGEIAEALRALHAGIMGRNAAMMLSDWGEQGEAERQIEAAMAKADAVLVRLPGAQEPEKT